MSDHHQAGYLGKRAAERLLDGASDHARLHALLAAAAAPARPEELSGEDAAVAAFMAAPRSTLATAPAPANAPAPETAPTSRMAALRRFLTIKVLAVVGGSLILTGGAAYATITGQLPGQDSAPSPSPSFDERKGTRGDEAPASESRSPAPSSSGGPSTVSPSPSTGKQHGKSGAPGQQKQKTRTPKPTPPRQTATPPRGPGNNNGTQPSGGGVEAGSSTAGGGTMSGSTTGKQAPPTTGTGSGQGKQD
ncbi:hypothetical protein [Actinomadura sp. 9N215]|uniref:hypothetical protein n=1 Tax=Actinomadura sp. 9N215 TaxID=3375150 RepID=UPI0037A0B919